MPGKHPFKKVGVAYRNNPAQDKKKWRLYILPQYLANQTKATEHIERYDLTAVVPIVTALLLSTLNDLQFFFVILYALSEFSCAKHYRSMCKCTSRQRIGRQSANEVRTGL